MRTIQGSLLVSSFFNSFVGFSLYGHLLLSSPKLVLITLLNNQLNKVAVQIALSLYHPLLAAWLSGATPPPASVVSQSIDLQGVGMLLEGIFGGAVGTTASVENVGLLGLTHIGSRRVVQISTGFMFFFAIFGKFGAFFASIPLPIFAAMYCVLFGIVAAVGITFIQFANNNSLRNIYVLVLSLFLVISIPQYFVSNTSPNGVGAVKTDGGWFDDILNTIFSSSPTVAIIVGTPLDNTLDAKYAVDDRGIAWWTPFPSRKGDVRNEKFYLLHRCNENMLGPVLPYGDFSTSQIQSCDQGTLTGTKWINGGTRHGLV